MGFSVDPDNDYRAPLFHGMMLYSDDDGDTWWFNSNHGYPSAVEAADGITYLYGGTFGRDSRHPVKFRDCTLAPRYLSYDHGMTWEGPGNNVKLDDLQSSAGVGFQTGDGELRLNLIKPLDREKNNIMAQVRINRMF